MLPLEPRQQKIYVTCLVEHNGHVLLLRGSQYADRASFGSIGYFGLPRFTLRFGADPVKTITRELQQQFGQSVDTPSIVSVSERLSNRHTQTVELVYRMSVPVPVAEQPGRYLFARRDQLEDYVLPSELEKLVTWLNRQG